MFANMGIGDMLSIFHQGVIPTTIMGGVVHVDDVRVPFGKAHVQRRFVLSIMRDGCSDTSGRQGKRNLEGPRSFRNATCLPQTQRLEAEKSMEITGEQVTGGE